MNAKAQKQEKDKDTGATTPDAGAAASEKDSTSKFVPAVGRVVHVCSQLFGRLNHQIACDVACNGAADRSKVKLPEFTPEVRPGLITHVNEGGTVDLVVFVNRQRDPVDQAVLEMSSAVVHDERPESIGDDVVAVAFVPPRN